MSFRTAIFSTTSLVFLAGTATADVTAKDIWKDWQSYMAGFGYAVDAQEAMSGNTLQVTDMTMTMPMPDGAGSFAITLDQIDFVENGDGTVSLVYAETMPMEFAFQMPEGEAIKGVVEYTIKNMNTLVSGDPANVTYATTGEEISIVLKELNIDGDQMPMDAMKARFTAKDISGQTSMEPGELRKITQNITFGATSYQVDFQDPEGSVGIVIDGKIAGMKMDGVSMVPATIDPENMSETLNNGFAVTGGFSYTGSTTEFAITEDGDTMSGSSGADAAEITVSMDKNSLEYAGSSKGVSLNVRGGEIPLPVVANFGELAFKLLMPIAKSENAGDFALGLTFADFETSEDLWSMLDAAKALPRDPATIALDLSGKAKMLFDFFDPEQMMAIEDGETMPAELQALTLNKLLVSIAGARLSGTGDFTFDNSDLETFNGMPKPTGGVDLALQGGNGLMDKLVEMGLLPQEQAMGARMMMGLFARPGEGEDSLTSKIEINAEGHILANGQRIQ